MSKETGKEVPVSPPQSDDEDWDEFDRQFAEEAALGLRVQASWGIKAGNDVIRRRREWRRREHED